MIGVGIKVDNMAPSITITGESYDSAHNRTTAEARSLNLQNNNNINGDNQNAGPVIEILPSDAYHQHFDQMNGNSCCEALLHLVDVSLSALRHKSRDLLSKRLNDIKVILSENGEPRDWRGILSSIGLSGDINLLQSNPNPTKEVLDRWQRDFDCKIRPTIGNLLQILGNIDRWDVIDDTKDFFVEDSSRYWESKSKDSKAVHNQASPSQHMYIYDDDTITVHDKYDQPEHYDALLLSSQEDMDFATQVLDILENENGLKMFSRHRDLQYGVPEISAMLTLISERSNRVVVIFSKTFFGCPDHAFYVNFAQHLSIEKRRRTIIPIIYEDCILPNEIRVYHSLFYRDATTKYYNFWDKLYKSIRVDPNESHLNYPVQMPEIMITTAESPSPVPSIESASQSPQPVIDFEALNTSKRKEESNSSPTTPTSPKKVCMETLTLSKSLTKLDTSSELGDSENERCRSSRSLGTPETNGTPGKSLYKIFKNKLTGLKPSTKSAESAKVKQKKPSKKDKQKTRKPVAEC